MGSIQQKRSVRRDLKTGKFTKTPTSESVENLRGARPMPKAETFTLDGQKARTRTLRDDVTMNLEIGEIKPAIQIQREAQAEWAESTAEPYRRPGQESTSDRRTMKSSGPNQQSLPNSSIKPTFRPMTTMEKISNWMDRPMTPWILLGMSAILAILVATYLP